jgi:3-dehydroquinate synthase
MEETSIAPAESQDGPAQKGPPGFAFEVSVPVVHRYAVRHESGLVDRFGPLLGETLGAARTVVLTDRRVARLHGERLLRSLRSCGIEAALLAIQEGERSKSLRTFTALLGKLAELRFDRRAVLVNFGGGMVCDLGGFLASAYMRGVKYVNFATTLMGQLDASIGGKVAVNAKAAKNLVGAFYHPALVAGDPDLLTTLSARDFHSGIAEAIKVGIIGCPELFAELAGSRAAIVAREPRALLAVIGLAAKAKMDWVSLDPYEADLRRPLNFGHTIGHPIETEFGYRKIRHGEAVAIGMGVATAISIRKGLIGAPDAARIFDLLQAYSLLGFDEPLRPDRMIEHVRFVRLIRGNALHFVLPRGIGDVIVTEDVTEADLVHGFEDYEEIVRERGA